MRIAGAEGLDPSHESLAVTMTDLQRSRQAGSRCTGHPGGTCSSARTGAYREHLLPAAVTTCLSVEAAAALGWDRHVIDRGIES